MQTSMASSGLAEVLDRIVDKGISAGRVGKSTPARSGDPHCWGQVVLAGVETCLKYAWAIGLTAPAA